MFMIGMAIKYYCNIIRHIGIQLWCHDQQVGKLHKSGRDDVEDDVDNAKISKGVHGLDEWKGTEYQ